MANAVAAEVGGCFLLLIDRFYIFIYSFIIIFLQMVMFVMIIVDILLFLV